MAAAADDDQIGPPVSGYRDDFLGGVAKGRLGRYPRCTLRLCLSARTVQHGLGRRNREFERRRRHMLQPSVFLDSRIDHRSEMWHDRQHDELGVVFACQISGEINRLEGGRRTVNADQNPLDGSFSCIGKPTESRWRRAYSRCVTERN
jgi:hypothetical protein